MIPIGTPARVYLVTTTTLIGLLTAAIGLWCLLDPRSFAGSVGFPAHEHFVHDVGAFQVGLGVMLLLALIWSDALATVLAGYIVGNTVHTVNHIVDLDLGGSASQAWALGAASVVLVVAFVLRLRQLGYVLGNVSVATDPLLVPVCSAEDDQAHHISQGWNPGNQSGQHRGRRRSCVLPHLRASDQGPPDSGTTPMSNSVRRQCPASRSGRCCRRRRACWREPSPAKQHGCCGASIRSFMAWWSRRYTA